MGGTRWEAGKVRVAISGGEAVVTDWGGAGVQVRSGEGGPPHQGSY